MAAGGTGAGAVTGINWNSLRQKKEKKGGSQRTQPTAEVMDMHQRQVKEDSSVLRKWDKEGSSGTSVPEVPKEGRWTETWWECTCSFSASVLGAEVACISLVPPADGTNSQ